jgi:hypothetical protein
MTPTMNAHASPARQAFTGSPLAISVGSMTTKTTKKMCGTDGPYGRAVTSLRPSRRAS